jgi:hypothetical protein
VPGWQQIWQLHRRTMTNNDEQWRIWKCAHKRSGIIDLFKICPCSLSPQIVPLWWAPILFIYMNPYFCEDFLDSRTCHPIFLHDKSHRLFVPYLLNGTWLDIVSEIMWWVFLPLRVVVSWA